MKTIVITGSTDGIGKLAAIRIAQAGHQVYLHGRNTDKLHASIAEVKAKTGNQNIDGFIADFSDLSSVMAMADVIITKLETIDVLINNAGVFKSRIDKTVDGLDVRFAVNYFAPYILTQHILPLLQQSCSSRVLNLSSAAQASVSLNALMGNEMIDENAAYAQSKLALTMWNNHLAKIYNNIQFIAVNPGSLLNTRMVDEAYGNHWSSADKGANILCELALNEAYQQASGQYFDNDKGQEKGTFGNAHADAYDKAKITALIESTQVVISKLFDKSTE